MSRTNLLGDFCNKIYQKLPKLSRKETARITSLA